MKIIGRLIKDFNIQLVNLFYPNPCLLCQSTLYGNEQLLCIACRLALPETRQHSDLASISSQYKFAGRIPIDFMCAYLYFTKKGKTQKLIHELKYKGEKEIGSILGRWYGQQLKDESDVMERVDLIIGVPLHPAKLRQRGYNQSDWFAMGLSEALEIPWCADVLIRSRKTVSQTGKDRLGRWENVSSVFAVAHPEKIQDKRILLVDDVLTTGATLEACAMTLLEAGCRTIGIITIAATR